ncbi:MFS transporter [Komagataeibacter oboediens]|uniref:MFS transporter n=1 Tax=Komagataeibacter oboediens TaxID=65958 RepID=A0A318QWP2_9PROT|nr:MFS transporter [Komagataeibacter oboediens]PYD81771.1 MFS transporter [Komagataeibacter oboediens]
MLFKTLPPGAMVGLFALFACTFTALTSEVAPVGILIEMAQAFHIREGQAGLAVSAFALMVMIAAIPLTIMTAHIDRKRLVVLSLLGYVASNLAVTVAPTFLILCAGRLIGGLAHALLMSIAAAYAARLVPQNMTGRAISFVYGGTSLGMVLGVPGAAAIGHMVGWRMAMGIMTVLAVVLTICIGFFLPPVSSPVQVREGLPAMAGQRAMRIFLVVVVVDAVFFFAHHLLYTYITPLLLAHGLSTGTLSIALLMTGGFSILGLWAAGLVVDRWPAAGLLGSGLAMLVGMGLMYGHILSGWMAVAAVGLWCIGYSAVVPFVMSGAIRARATRPDVAGAAINAACNMGILLGSAVGGEVLSNGGFAVLTPLSCAMVLLGMIVAMLNPAAFPRALTPAEEEG